MEAHPKMPKGVRHMAHVGSLRNHSFGEHTDADDIRGAKVYGRDNDKLGEIADVIFDHHSGNVQYVVVDTGGWFTHKQFLVPADRLQSHEGQNSDDEFHVNLSKDEVERFPKYDPESVHDEQQWNRYEGEYREASRDYFSGGDVLHRADSPNIITEPGLPASGSGGDLGAVDARIRPMAGNVIAGAMNTTANAWGQQQDTRRLTPATRTDAFSPDVHSTDTEAAREQSVDAERSRGFDQEAVATGNPLGLNADRGYVPQDRERNASTVSDPDFQLNRSSNEPFRREDVGAQSSQSNRLEELYDHDDADMYQASRSGQPPPGEFANAGNSPSGSQIRGNYSNASDSEFRTAEGDSRFNVSDPQLRENAPDEYQSDSGVTPELTELL